MRWRDNAACQGADPVNFDPVDLHTKAELDVLAWAAQNWCSWCPVRVECAAFADESRHTGLYGGVYRRIKQGRYVWDVLADGATAPQLTDRRVGVRTGWGAA